MAAGGDSESNSLLIKALVDQPTKTRTGGCPSTASPHRANLADDRRGVP